MAMQQITFIENGQHQLRVAANTQAMVLLGYAEAAGYDNTFELLVEQDACVTVYHLQNVSPKADIRNQFIIEQHKNSSVTMMDLTVGGATATNQVDVHLNGEHAHCDLKGIFISDKKQYLSNRINMHHNAPHTQSSQVYKGIAGDESAGECLSRVIVKKGAQKIESKQSSQNLLLNSGATIRTLPELEIYADDVQCAHGATVGELDDNILFYLRSRGIPLEVARAILTYSLIGEVLNTVVDKTIRATMLQAVIPKIPNSEQLDLKP